MYDELVAAVETTRSKTNTILTITKLTSRVGFELTFLAFITRYIQDEIVWC